ncbi:MAG: hypothetical protein R3C40_03215 [Parvularculaceae bacterium]
MAKGRRATSAPIANIRAAEKRISAGEQTHRRANAPNSATAEITAATFTGDGAPTRSGSSGRNAPAANVTGKTRTPRRGGAEIVGV